MRLFLATIILVLLLAAYKLGYKAAQDVQARQSDTEYMETYMLEH